MDLAKGINIIRLRLMKRVESGEGFDCAHCMLPKPASDAMFIGVFVPPDGTMTEAGSKLRVVGYILCKSCVKTQKVDVKVSERVEINLITAGVFLDPTYRPYTLREGEGDGEKKC